MPPSRDWIKQANCLGIDTNLFYPDRHEESTGIDARAVCAQCVVREECLSYALQTGERFGIWGGTSERQRKKMRRADYRHERILDVRLA